MTETPIDAGVTLRADGPESVRGWEQCRRALAGRDLVSDPSAAGLTGQPGNNLLLLDGELHRRLRRLVMPYLTRPKRVARVRADLETLADELVRALPGQETADLVTGLAEPLVLAGIMSAMEIPEQRRDKLGELTKQMLGLLEPDLPPAERRSTRRAALRATLIFEHDAAAGHSTGLHAALEEAAADGVIPVKLARSTPVVVLHGGYENPLNLLGCVIAWAAGHPEDFARAAAADPGALLEEITRSSSPVRVVARWAGTDRTAEDPPLHRGEPVWVDLESANHDACQFAEPDAVNLANHSRHLGYGYGQHACPGASLSRVQGHVLITALLRLPPGFLSDFRTQWREGIVARGPMTILRR